MSTTLVPGVLATSINSNIADATAGTEFQMPFQKGGGKIAFHLVYTGGPSAVSIAFQISLDGTNWATVATSTDASGELVIVNNIVAKYVRLYHTSRTGGTNVLGQLLLL